MSARAYGVRAWCVALAGLGALALVPASASGAGGPVVPGATWDTSVTTPSSDYSYAAFYNRPGATIAKIEKGTGAVVRARWPREPFGLPAVTQSGTAGGLSADGETLVLVRSEPRINVRETVFAIADTDPLKFDRITLDGAYGFDAISPDGRWMYLTEYPNPRDPYDYSVRAYDIEAGRFQHAPIVDPREPDEPMTGIPLGRVMSPDGRWAYTLYGGGAETFIHALDTVGRTAVCVDLPQLEGVRNIYLLGLEPSGDDGLAITSRGKAAALVDTETFAITEPEAASASAADDEGGGLPWAWATAALAVVLAAGLVIVRRRLVRVDDRPATSEGQSREWEPVP